MRGGEGTVSKYPCITLAAICTSFYVILSTSPLKPLSALRVRMKARSGNYLAHGQSAGKWLMQGPARRSRALDAPPPCFNENSSAFTYFAPITFWFEEWILLERVCVLQTGPFCCFSSPPGGFELAALPNSWPCAHPTPSTVAPSGS